LDLHHDLFFVAPTNCELASSSVVVWLPVNEADEGVGMLRPSASAVHRKMPGTYWMQMDLSYWRKRKSRLVVAVNPNGTHVLIRLTALLSTATPPSHSTIDHKTNAHACSSRESAAMVARNYTPSL
jgi:hypothetical protein